MAFFAKPTCKVRNGVGVGTSALYCTSCLVYTSSWPSIITKVDLRPHWKCGSEQFGAPKPRSAKKESIKVRGFIPSIVKIGTQQVRGWFGVFKSLAFDILLGPTGIHSCMKGIFPLYKKTVAIYLTTVPTLGRGRDLYKT